MSSDGRNFQLKEKCSTEEVQEFRYYCGCAGLTYLEQLHPNISDVPTRASVCMNTFFVHSQKIVRDDIPRSDCNCNSRQKILVQNCSGFYVYQLAPISHSQVECPARYCTENLSKCYVPTFTNYSNSLLKFVAWKLNVYHLIKDKQYFLCIL